SLKDGTALLNTQYQKMDETALDETEAFLLGFFTADGNFLWDNRNGRNLSGIQFSIGTRDSELIERIRTQIQAVWKTDAKFKKDPRYNTAYLYVYRRKIAKRIRQAGFNKHGRLPDVLLNSPKTVILAFLEGFFQGDGYDKRNEIHINDLELAEDLARLYGLVGIPTIFKKKKNSQRIYLQTRRTDTNVAGLVTTPCLHERVPGFMAKSTYVVPGLSKGRMVGSATLQKYAAHTTESLRWEQGDAYPVRVTSVSSEESEEGLEFYDVELEGNHLFLHSLGTITHNCCRLRLDNRELRKRGGGLFGANPLTGSVGVVTINMPRIGFVAKSEEAYFHQLDALMDLARDSLETKRKVLEEFTDRGLYPYSKYYLRDIKTAFGAYWKNHFATIGLIGLNESIQNFLGVCIADVHGKAFAIKVLEHMRNRLGQYQAETGNIYNLEATPGEGTSYRLARLDVKHHPGIHVANPEASANGGAPYYTNSSHLPVGHTKDIFEALEHQDDLQRQYTGGTVLHGFVGERISDWRTARELVKKIATNFRLPYFTLTPTFSVCPNHGYMAGEHVYCPRCDEEIGYIQIDANGAETQNEKIKQGG
ncbi:MAG: anaerobic ribonucleoside-triphosphate reductase, partial [Candidatus Micrarchaeota archaeon]|nr:anaerobic ribonucleoside-triphosphate reductase [Candidatus Micrarchaeota archaeon]